MRIDLDQLNTFIYVSKIGSIKSAAEELFISQSTVNSRIRVIEEELGYELLKRNGRGVSLTQKGEIFLDYAQRTIELVTAGLDQVKKQKLKTSTFQIASVTLVATYFLPKMIEAFRNNGKKVIIKVDTSSTSKIIDGVINGEVELGLVRGPFQHNGIIHEKLYTEAIIPIMSPSHPWNKLTEVSPKDFLNEVILTSGRQTYLWQSVVNWFKEYGITPRVGMEVDHIETTKRMILHDFGVSFVPEMSVRKELEQGELKGVPLIPKLNLYRDTILIRHKSKPLSNDALRFWNFLIETKERSEV